jgi:hypothetical protein
MDSGGNSPRVSDWFERLLCGDEFVVGQDGSGSRAPMAARPPNVSKAPFAATAHGGV